MNSRKIITCIPFAILIGVLGFGVYYWNQPMIFGKVVDQHGAPVEGAKVSVLYSALTLGKGGNSTH